MIKLRVAMHKYNISIVNLECWNSDYNISIVKVTCYIHPKYNISIVSKVGDGSCLLYYNIVSFGDSSNKLRTTDHLSYYNILFDISIIVYSPSSIYIFLFIINSFIINHLSIYNILCYDDILINQKEVLSYYD